MPTSPNNFSAEIADLERGAAAQTLAIDGLTTEIANAIAAFNQTNETTFTTLAEVLNYISLQFGEGG